MSSIAENNTNLILINNSNRIIPVYETYGATGSCVDATGAQIGYIAVGERYSFAKKDGESVFRKVVINTGGSTTKTGYISIAYCPHTEGASGYFSFVDDQVKVNGMRSSGDYVDLNGTTYARYATNAAVTIYDFNGVARATLPRGSHVLSSSSIAGESNPKLMSFDYKLVPGATEWQPLYNGTWGWLDVITTGTVSGSMKIA